MKKSSYIAIAVGSAFAALSAQGQTAYVWTGGGDDSSWTDPANWNPNTSLAGPTTGDGAQIRTLGSADEVVVFSSGNVVLNNTSTSLQTAGNNPGYTAALNILGGSLTSLGTVEINPASGGDSDAAINVTGGTLVANQLYLGRDGGLSTLGVSSGSFILSGTGGGAKIWMRADGGNLSASLFDISGSGSFLSTNLNGTFDMQTYNAKIRVSGNGSFAMTGTQNPILNMDVGTAAGSAAMIELLGSTATMSLKNFDALTLTNTTEAILRFVADADGISTINVGKALKLSLDATTQSSVELDLTGYDFANGNEFVLLDYSGGTFNGGSFDNISVTGGTFQGIDYATGNQVVLTAVAVPEPGALALLALGLASWAVRRRRA